MPAKFLNGPRQVIGGWEALREAAPLEWRVAD